MLRYAIIGSGMMGQEHIRNLHLTGAEVALIAEPDARMKSRSAELAPEAKLVDSLDELDDVEKVYTNLNITDEMFELYAQD